MYLTDSSTRTTTLSRKRVAGFQTRGALKLVPKVAHARKHHRHTMFVGCGYDFLVANGTAGLDDAANPNARGVIDTIAEGEEGV